MKAQMQFEELVQQLTSEPWVLMLVGLPGTGKSTFIERLQERKKFLVASTDNLIEVEAKASGRTYSQVHREMASKTFRVEMNKRVAEAVKLQQNVVYDQTNMTRKSRNAKFTPFYKGYTKLILVFTLDEALLEQRLHDRARATGKFIPPTVMQSMRASYEEPNVLTDKVSHVWFFEQSGLREMICPYIKLDRK